MPSARLTRVSYSIKPRTLKNTKLTWNDFNKTQNSLHFWKMFDCVYQKWSTQGCLMHAFGHKYRIEVTRLSDSQRRPWLGAEQNFLTRAILGHFSFLAIPSSKMKLFFSIWCANSCTNCTRVAHQIELMRTNEELRNRFYKIWMAKNASFVRTQNLKNDYEWKMKNAHAWLWMAKNEKWPRMAMVRKFCSTPYWCKWSVNVVNKKLTHLKFWPS